MPLTVRPLASLSVVKEDAPGRRHKCMLLLLATRMLSPS